MNTDVLPELKDYKGFVKQARETAKKRLGGQMYSTRHPAGESKEDYDETLRDETRLEIAYKLREIADTVERNTINRPKYDDIRQDIPEEALTVDDL